MTENEYIEFCLNIHEVYLHSDLTDEQIQEIINMTNDSISIDELEVLND